MTKQLKDYLDSLNIPYKVENVIGRTDFYYLELNWKRNHCRILMNGEETPEDLKSYMMNKHGIEL